MNNALTASILIIGNEVLSGRTQDSHVSFLAQRLEKHGIELREVGIVPDDEDMIVQALTRMMLQYTYVFTTGGIGITHDDITKYAVAKAFKVSCEENPELLVEIQKYYGKRFTENCRKHALIPKGAVFIPSSLSHVPVVWKMDNVFCLAGIPTVMRSMFLSLEHTLKRGSPIYTQEITCLLLEDDIADKLEKIQLSCPNIQIGSYPFYEPEQCGVHLVIKGRSQQDVIDARSKLIHMSQILKVEPILH